MLTMDQYDALMELQPLVKKDSPCYLFRYDNELTDTVRAINERLLDDLDCLEDVINQLRNLIQAYFKENHDSPIILGFDIVERLTLDLNILSLSPSLFHSIVDMLNSWLKRDIVVDIQKNKLFLWRHITDSFRLIIKKIVQTLETTYFDLFGATN